MKGRVGVDAGGTLLKIAYAAAANLEPLAHCLHYRRKEKHSISNLPSK